MNAVVKPYHEMCLNSSELIVPRDTYQRALHPARVARIAKEFDERVANEPKISFRDGHYYVMDGQNTIAAREISERRRRFADSLQGLFWYDRTRRSPPVCTADRHFGTAECRTEAPCPDFCRGACCRCIPAGHRIGWRSSFF